MNFDIFPARDQKIEFPPTAAGFLRRIVFYSGAGFAILCGIAILSSIAIAAIKLITQLIYPH